MKFYGGSVEGIVNFDKRCATFTFYTFILITSLYIVYYEKLAFLTLVSPRSIDVVAWPVQRKFSRCGEVQKSCNEHRDPFPSELGVVYYIQRCDKCVELLSVEFTIGSDRRNLFHLKELWFTG